MFSFNLVDEPWLPCRAPGGELRDVSLREALVDAHRIEEIFHPSPLVAASLHRLLLALVHRVFGPGGVESWQALWQAGLFDAARVHPYLDAWRSRFDLFDEERPFYQVASLPPERAVPAQKLSPELATGNNATLFDHTIDANPVAVTPQQAACLLVALQSYAMGGLLTRLPGDPPSAEAGPLTKGALALLRGGSLYSTLLLNWCPGSENREALPRRAADDMPAWERHEETCSRARTPVGYTDLLTWQSRRALLVPETRSGETVVRWAVIMRGENFPDDFRPELHEPMLAYRKMEKARPGQEPWLPVGFDRDRATWRDSTTFLVRGAQTSHPPRTLEWIADLVWSGSLDPAFTPPLELLGMVSTQAKIVLWRREQMPLPLSYLADPALIQTLQDALDLAESVGQGLLGSLRQLEIELARPAREPSAPVRRQDTAAVRRLEQDGLRSYWSELGREFKPFMTGLPEDRLEQDGVTRYGLRIVPGWKHALRQAAQGAFDEQTGGLEESRRTLRAVAIARRILARRLGQVLVTSEIEEVAGAPAS